MTQVAHHLRTLGQSKDEIRPAFWNVRRQQGGEWVGGREPGAKKGQRQANSCLDGGPVGRRKPENWKEAEPQNWHLNA